MRTLSLFISIIMNILLKFDERSSGDGFIDYFNYICIVVLVIIIILCLVQRKRIIKDFVESGIRIQWTYIFQAILWILLLISAITDIFNTGDGSILIF